MLIVGCGDIGLRAARQLPPRLKVMALTSSPARGPELRAQGITALHGNLDEPASLRRLAGLATRVLHLAPPPGDHPDWRTDPRTLALLRALRLRALLLLTRALAEMGEAPQAAEYSTWEHLRL